MKKTKLMFSYGMNTNLAQMAVRCPGAVSLGKCILPMFEFNFKSYATVDFKLDAVTEGVLWEIDSDHEIALDFLEGYPTHYSKQTVTVLHNGVNVEAMVYVMNADELEPPSNSYTNMLYEGYANHDIAVDQIDQAFNRASDYLFLTFRQKYSTV